MNLRTSWYRAAFATALFLPALIIAAQIVPQAMLDSWSESVYAALLTWQTPRTTTPSAVLVLEADQKTMNALGWPIDHSYYIQALDRLKTAGSPWVLSLLSFQATGKSTANSETKSHREQLDEGLIAAIKNYGKVIGTGLEIRQGSELDADQEDELMPRITLARAGKAPADLPRLPLALEEDARVVKGERAFGFGTRFGLEPVVRCMQMYLTDKAETGQFVIPSALVWAAAFTTNRGFTTPSGASWPRQDEDGPPPSTGQLQVSIKECLTSPSIATDAFLNQRQVQRLSLVDLLRAETLPDLKDRVVVLATSEMRRYQGTGGSSAGDGITPEYMLAARFLDGLITGDLIGRGHLSDHDASAWLPLGLAAVAMAASLLCPPGGVVLTVFGLLTALLAQSAYFLNSGVYVVPMATLLSLATSLVLLCVLYGYLKYYGAQRQIVFSNRLRSSMAACNTLVEVERLAREICKETFVSSNLEFKDFDRDLFDAASDAHKALALIDSRRKASSSDLQRRRQTALTRARRPRGIGRVPLSARGLDCELAIESKAGYLGMVHLSLVYPPHEEAYITGMLETLQIEVTQHWHRIRLLVDQKLLDYRYVLEQSRSDIMSRFLAKALVAKFTDGQSMEENLRTVLTPRPTQAALFQADLRGYTKMSARLSPEDTVRLLQGYFRRVVDVAQMLGQVKLIGDCIFVFIEREAGDLRASAADHALELAALLSSETMRLNGLRGGTGEEDLNFGMAVHFGDVVVGNLSSDSCIDYTVIGRNVNLVARLEELTKNPAIVDCIGHNGVIVSREAQAALIRYSGQTFKELNVDTLGVAVRSFAEIKVVGGLTAATAQELLGTPPPRTLPLAS